MIDVSRLAAGVGKFVAKNCPVICAVAGIGFAGWAVYEAIKATPKAIEIKKELDRQNAKKFDYLKAVTPCYWKSIALFTTGTGFVIGGNYVSARRLSVATATAEITGIALDETRRAIHDVAGEEIEAKIMDRVGERYIEERADDPEFENYANIPFHGNGHVLIMDGTLGGTFRSSKNEVEKTFNEAQKELLKETYISSNRFMDLFDRPPTTKGEYEGWSRYLNPDETIEILGWSHDIDKVTGEPCLVVYYTPPYPDFDKDI